jgi:hypothetical protein
LNFELATLNSELYGDDEKDSREEGHGQDEEDGGRRC